MEAERATLPFASWKPRKVGGVIPVQAQKLENQGSQWCKSQPESKDLRTGITDVHAQKEMDVPFQVERANLPFL